MRLLPIALIIFMAAPAAPFGDKKNEARFSPGPASSYASKQTNENVTIAAVPYDSEELARSAFGKVNPAHYDVLPILVIIQNDTQQTLRLDGMQVEYLGLDRSRIGPTPAAEVKYAGPGPKRPGTSPGTGPIPPGLIKHKNPLAAPEIEARAFAARMLPPHESANGFFYFQTRHLPGSKLYLTGISEAGTGKEIYYFEIPLP